MNCEREVSQADGKFFAGVFVCPDCHFVAERLYERAHHVLKLMLVMMKDTIRMALTQRRVSFKSSESVDRLTKPQLLATLSKMVSDEDQSCDGEKIQSLESTKPSAGTADSE